MQYVVSETIFNENTPSRWTTITWTSNSGTNFVMKLNSFHKVNKSDGDYCEEKLTSHTIQVVAYIHYHCWKNKLSNELHFFNSDVYNLNK